MDRVDESRVFSKENLVQDIEQMWYVFAERINFLVDRVLASSVEIIKPGNVVGDNGNWRVTCDSNGDLTQYHKESGTWVYRGKKTKGS